MEALRAALTADPKGLWTVEFRFEGLRILPVALRLLAGMEATTSSELLMLFPDAGATALAKRDGPAFSERLLSLRDLMRLQQADGGSNGVLVIVAPKPADYEEVEQVCAQHRGAVVMINGDLEDAAVGIGSVARERRRGFLSGWQSAYAVIPLGDGALRRAYPLPWQLYRLDPDGHRFVAEFEQKPDAEARVEAMAGANGAGLAGNLQAIESFIEGLSH